VWSEDPEVVVREKNAPLDEEQEKIVLADLGNEKNPEILKFAGNSPGCTKTRLYFSSATSNPPSSASPSFLRLSAPFSFC